VPLGGEKTLKYERRTLKHHLKVGKDYWERRTVDPVDGGKWKTRQEEPANPRGRRSKGGDRCAARSSSQIEVANSANGASGGGHTRGRFLATLKANHHTYIGLRCGPDQGPLGPVKQGGNSGRQSSTWGGGGKWLVESGS